MVELAGDPKVAELYAAFREYNERFFDGELAAPLVLVTATGTARTLGDYCARDAHGLSSRIRIAPASVKRGKRFALDVLLHEMVHAWQSEIVEDLEPGYRGHGPVFAGKCNEIGKALGLPEVGVKGRGGLPACNHWPQVVRPEDYYETPYVKPTRKPSERDESEGDGEGEGDESEGERLTGIDLVPALKAMLAHLQDYSRVHKIGRQTLDQIAELGGQIARACDDDLYRRETEDGAKAAE